MSIDPNEFIKKENKPVKEEFDTITGSFSCQSCDESVDSAFYDEENRYFGIVLAVKETRLDYERSKRD
jgi:uncharacterized protein (UPF0212 family)